jgi:diguanylate cyclase (GGDEF)-like protein
MKKSKLLQLHQAAMARAQAAEALYKAAVARAEVAEARERFAAEQREKFAAEREALALARDKAALERDAIANARDKAAAERDASANARYSATRGASANGNGIGNGNGTVVTTGATGASAPAPTTAAAIMTEQDDSRDPELELANLEARLQRAHLDALTGAYRREMGRLALKNEIDRARRTDGRFVIAFLDVDGLKGVNDREGHAAGDRILRTLVATMRANLRSYDPIVRFGGDEFICGIASIDPAEAQHRIHVIDQSLRNATGVGVTAGLAALTSNETLEELTARADAALIENKRNRPN